MDSNLRRFAGVRERSDRKPAAEFLSESRRAGRVEGPLLSREFGIELVGPNGLEPSTSSVSRKRSNQLSYGPTLSAGQLLFYLRGSEAAMKRGLQLAFHSANAQTLAIRPWNTASPPSDRLSRLAAW